MAETASPQDVAPPAKRRLRPLLLGLLLGVFAAGGAFYVTWSGMISLPGQGHGRADVAALPDIAFVPLDPILVSLAPGMRSRHLRFSAQLEVGSQHRAEVERLRPRIADLMNGYLRAIDPTELEAAGALVRLRAQLLRRIQIVTGEGRVRDLLVTEFVLN